MKSSAWLFVAAIWAAGCNLPQDQGVVMGCFGLVNEAVPGTVRIYYPGSDQRVFGGCNPDDPGMQIVERVRPESAADQTAMAQICDSDCNARLTAYGLAHPEAKLPLTCQTLFAIPCDNMGADISQIPASSPGAYQAGGPADTRLQLTGNVTLTVSGSSTTVPARGIVDGTMAPCEGADQNCTLTLSRLDVVAMQSFAVNGVAIDGAHVQNQGLAVGHRNAGEMLIPAGAIEAEVSATVGGSFSTFHVTSTSDVKSTNPNLTLEQFLSTLNLTMTQGNVTVRMQLTGTPIGRRPVASFSPRPSSVECTCKACTTVTFTSGASDPDSDLQSLAWTLDSVPTLGQDINDPETLGLSLPLGNHTVSLVATDSRGAAAGSSLQFSVADTKPPIITVPPDATLRSCDFPDIGRATAKDVCSDVAVVCSNSSGNFPVGTSTVTWTAEDGSYNDGTATQRVTVTQVNDFRTCCPAGYNVIVVPQTNTAIVNGTAGNDCIIGTSNNDCINGNGGDDIIFGLGGQDTLSGGPGNDTIMGGDGDDIIDGGDGDDKLAGGTGQDRITGGLGNDTILGGDGVDTIDGGDGDDTIYGNQGTDIIAGGNGNDFIDGGPDDDQINGNAGDDVLVGCADNDTITDTIGNNVIEGFIGDDHLTGGSGRRHHPGRQRPQHLCGRRRIRQHHLHQLANGWTRRPEEPACAKGRRACFDLDASDQGPCAVLPG